MLAQMFANAAKFPSLRRAIIHPSCRNATPEDRLEFQRLEFLGDAALDLIVTEMVMRAFPQEAEGGLTVRRARLVEERSLALWAHRVDLAARIGNTMNLITDRVLADSVEAILGAIYKDCGLDPLREFVENEVLRSAFELELEKCPPGLDKTGDWNAKGDLQNVVQRVDLGMQIEYELLASEGPSHMRMFKMGVKVNGELLGVGEANTKKLAEKAAAGEALAVFRKRHGPVLNKRKLHQQQVDGEEHSQDGEAQRQAKRERILEMNGAGELPVLPPVTKPEAPPAQERRVVRFILKSRHPNRTSFPPLPPPQQVPIPEPAPASMTTTGSVKPVVLVQRSTRIKRKEPVPVPRQVEAQQEEEESAAATTTTRKTRRKTNS